MLWMVLMLVLLIPLTAVILDSQLGRALAARLERGAPREEDRLTRERLAALETEVDRLSREVQHIGEESDFLRRLLEERPARPALPPERDRD
jgi:hypothetical protein